MARPLLLFILTMVLLSGCGQGDGGAALAGGPEPIPSFRTTTTSPTGMFSFSPGGDLTGRVSGTVWLDGPNAARVRLFPHNGEFRVEATLPDGNIMLADVSLAPVDTLVLQGLPGVGPFEPEGWVWVTPISTLLALYRDARPDLADSERQIRLKRFLGISESQSVNRPFSSRGQTQFSPRAFLDAAGAQGLLEFARNLIAELEQEQARSFLNLETPPGVVPPAVAGPSRLIGLMDSVGAGLVTDLIWKGLGWAVGKMGLGSSTNKQLDQIQQQLSQINSEVEALQQSLPGLGTGTLAGNVASDDIAPVYTYYTHENTVLTNSQSQYTPFSFNNATFLATSDFTFLTGQQSSGPLGSAQGILGGCLNITPYANQGNLITGLTQNFVKAWGSGTSNAALATSNTAFFYDFRNDVLVTPTVQGYADYYLGFLGQACNQVAETETRALGLNTSPPSASIQLAQSYLNGSTYTQVAQGDSTQNGLLALGRRLQQQRPLALIGGASALQPVWGAPAANENVAGTGIVNGTLWANCTEVTTANDFGETAVYIDTVGQFNINNYYNWFLPSASEAKQLCQYATQAAIADGITNKDQQIPYGLHKLGLLSDANYKTGMTNVGIYCSLTTDKDNPSCQILETKDLSLDSGGLYEAGLNAYGFKGTSDNPRLVLLVRPFPGQPQGAGGYSRQGNTSATGVATTTGPDAVMQSATARAIQAGGDQLFLWNSDLALAGNFPPTEIVVGRDPNSNQLRAYGIWQVGWPSVPGVYRDTNQTFVNLAKYYPNLGYTPGQYIVYVELTNLVEWLSSNTSVAEVSNYSLTNLSTYGGTVTQAALSGPGLVILDPVIDSSSLTRRTITGGTVLSAIIASRDAFEGTVSPTLSGATSQSLGTPMGNLDPTGATISGGTITSGILDSDQGLQIITLTDLSGTTHTVANGGGIRNATVTGGVVTLPSGSPYSGVLTVHNPAQPVTITASWLASPSTTNLTNLIASQSIFLTGTLSLPAGSIMQPPVNRSLVVSPNFANIRLSAAGSDMTCFVTGFNADGTCLDLSTNAATKYTLFQQVGNDQTFQEVPANLASFGGVSAGGQPIQPNVLQFHAGFSTYSGLLIIRAVNSTSTGFAFLSALAAP